MAYYLIMLSHYIIPWHICFLNILVAHRPIIMVHTTDILAYCISPYHQSDAHIIPLYIINLYPTYIHTYTYPIYHLFWLILIKWSFP